jgi:hypothetical protein
LRRKGRRHGRDGKAKDIKREIGEAGSAGERAIARGPTGGSERDK